ncbi:hypothetical protein, partial [Bradyrhizobium japonicum]|uniref:hypothetical protein n=2 Tax=Bradyrhizobium TaxID=374 RepID=UPI001AEC605C
GFISESWPASNRNDGRLQVGIPGRNKSESAQLGWRGAQQAIPLKIRNPERQKKRETESVMYAHKELLARSACC